MNSGIAALVATSGQVGSVIILNRFPVIIVSDVNYFWLNRHSTFLMPITIVALTQRLVEAMSFQASFYQYRAHMIFYYLCTFFSARSSLASIGNTNSNMKENSPKHSGSSGQMIQWCKSPIDGIITSNFTTVRDLSTFLLRLRRDLQAKRKRNTVVTDEISCTCMWF